MTDYLKGHVSNVSDLINEKANVLSDAVHQLMQGKTGKYKSLNATLDEIDKDLDKRGMNDEEKKKFRQGIAITIAERGIHLAAELAKEDFDQIDIKPMNGKIQKCELDAFVAKERLHAGLMKNVALDKLVKEAAQFAPGSDKCACDYEMASKAQVESYERRQAALLLNIPYFNSLCNDRTIFSQLSGNSDSLNYDSVQADKAISQDKFCNLTKQLYELGEQEDFTVKTFSEQSAAGKVTDEQQRAYEIAMSAFEKEKTACKVMARDLYDRRIAEIRILENWDKIQDSTGHVTQSGLANYAKSIQFKPVDTKPGK